MIFGEASVLEGVKVTAHINAHSVCESLERSCGSQCTNALIEQDGNIITADGFNSPASWFGSYVAKAISIDLENRKFLPVFHTYPIQSRSTRLRRAFLASLPDNLGELIPRHGPTHKCIF